MQLFPALSLPFARPALSFAIPSIFTDHRANPGHQTSHFATLKKLAEEAKKQGLTMSSNGKACVLKFAKLSEKAFAPTRGSAQAAGYDLRSAYEYVVPAHGKEVVHTDLQIAVPEGTYGRVAPRSGLAWKNFIDVGAGVIDADYRGKLGVILYNHSSEDFKVNPGDRIAQLICEKIAYPELEELKQLDETARGGAGFGSTGVQ